MRAQTSLQSDTNPGVPRDVRDEPPSDDSQQLELERTPSLLVRPPGFMKVSWRKRARPDRKLDPQLGGMGQVRFQTASDRCFSPSLDLRSPQPKLELCGHVCCFVMNLCCFVSSLLPRLNIWNQHPLLSTQHTHTHTHSGTLSAPGTATLQHSLPLCRLLNSIHAVPQLFFELSHFLLFAFA